MPWLEKYLFLCTSVNTSKGVMKKAYREPSQIAFLPYWYRVWVFQKLVLASRATLACGTEVVSLHLLLVVERWLTELRDESSIDLPLPFMHSRYWSHLFRLRFKILSSTIRANMVILHQRDRPEEVRTMDSG